ncbi:unnamed protein product [Albugo candida]|uniref:Uncharacterized protein n=1 Tax=Albugo candida TaxID=65357 RepID=A0A024FTT8_9STRA|nr:unnamed protein product [Albugo candida]|eukprot:CCI10357.1 unnamed protein product [Albugo candida]
MVIKVFDGEVEMRRSPTKVFHEQLYSSPSVLYLCLLAHAYKVAIQSVTQTFLSSEFYKSSRRCYQHNKLFLIFRTRYDTFSPITRVPVVRRKQCHICGLFVYFSCACHNFSETIDTFAGILCLTEHPSRNDKLRISLELEVFLCLPMRSPDCRSSNNSCNASEFFHRIRDIKATSNELWLYPQTSDSSYDGTSKLLSQRHFAYYFVIITHFSLAIHCNEISFEQKASRTHQKAVFQKQSPCL